MFLGEEADKWARLAERIGACNSEGIPLPADTAEEFAGRVRERCRISICGRRIPYDDAEDLTQDISMRLLGALPRFRGPRGGDSLFLWVRVTISNSIKTYFAEKAKNPTIRLEEILRKLDGTVDIDEFMETLGRGQAAVSTEANVFARDLRERLCTALAALPNRQRLCWKMHHVSGLTFHEIARVLKISEDAAKMAASRATKTLKSVLDKYEFEPARKPG